MKWYVLRHADKEAGNFYNSTLRHHDQPISAKGQVEAQKLCSYFAERPVARIFVSQYVRTAQTITYVAQQMKLSPVVDGRLNEIDIGLVDGLSDQEIRHKYPEVWNALIARDRDFRFPGGESGADALGRIEAFMQEMLAGGEDIILVSHDGLIRLLTCHILGLAVYRRWDFRVDTCGLMEIEYQTAYERWKMHRFNHLCG